MRWRLLAILLTLIVAGSAHAERLPITTFGAAEGLPGSHLTNVTRDSRGFLWFGTRDGVSRFDGIRFVNYGVEHGLADPTVNEVIESRDGGHWIATNGGGACRLPADAAHPAYEGTRGTAPRLFTCLRMSDDSLANNVNTLHEEAAGRLWAGSDGGLFVLDPASTPQRFEPVLLPRTHGGLGMSPVSHIISDRAHGLWIASRFGLVHRAADGTFTHFGAEAPSTVGGETLTRLLLDSQQRLWMGLYGGLLVMRPDLTRPPAAGILLHAWSRQPAAPPAAGDGAAEGGAASQAGYTVELPDEPGEIVRVPLDFPRPLASVRALLETTGGEIWIGTTDGVLQLAGTRLRAYTAAEGFTSTDVRGIAEDPDGNIWFASTGALKLTRNGFVTYTAADGLGDPNARSFYETTDGRLHVVTGDWIVNELIGPRFRAVRLPVPAGTIQHWGSPAAVLDHEDRWWVLGVQGLWHLPPWRGLEDLSRPFPPLMRPAAADTSSPGAAADATFHPTAWLIEDTRRDVWAALLSRPTRVVRWERATGRVRAFTEADGLPHEFPTVMLEDASGGIWVGFRSGGVARLRGDRFTVYGPAQGMASGMVTAMHADTRGRLWIGTNSGGLARVDDLDAAAPRFVHYTSAQGLGSNNVRCLTSDASGRLYIGTARGVDRLDPDGGHVRHYTTLDGLAFGLPMTAFRDSRGRLWFGMSHGVSRLDPAPEPAPDLARTPPRVWIDALHVAGVAQPLSHLGVTEAPAITVGPNDNQLDVQFFGLTFAMGGTLRYQYRLENADQDWSPPTREQRVHYSALAPGRYRFLVRAVNADGAVSAEPATARFVVLPPVWQRAWFRLSIAVLLVLGATAVYRLRVARLIELERIRTRIASDLHDDIGSNLSRMAILSEVAKRQIGDENPQPARHLTEIADSARTLIDAMSDIVWSIDPRHDDLGSVIVRVREFAADVLASNGVKWSCLAPPDLDRIRLRPDARRHLLLLLKEGVTNIARHAEARTARLRVELEAGHLIAELSDDGRGFIVPDIAGEPPPRARGGHGLSSMRWRVAELGGTLHTISAPGAGTHLRVTVPLRGPLGASHARAMGSSPVIRQDGQS